MKRNEMIRPESWRESLLFCALGFGLLTIMTGCSPKIEVAPSDKPITINLNVKIEHEVRVKIDKELDEQIFSENSDLF